MSMYAMIEVKSNIGWTDYCQTNIVTNLSDIDGVQLKTGDIVEVLDRDYYEAGIEDCQVCHGQMIIFDQYQKFISTDKFYVEGWLDADWEGGNFLIRKVGSINHDPASHYRIIGHLT